LYARFESSLYVADSSHSVRRWSRSAKPKEDGDGTDASARVDTQQHQHDVDNGADWTEEMPLPTSRFQSIDHQGGKGAPPPRIALRTPPTSTRGRPSIHPEAVAFASSRPRLVRRQAPPPLLLWGERKRGSEKLAFLADPCAQLDSHRSPVVVVVIMVLAGPPTLRSAPPPSSFSA
jgi:hypothetical protein